MRVGGGIRAAEEEAEGSGEGRDCQLWDHDGPSHEGFSVVAAVGQQCVEQQDLGQRHRSRDQPHIGIHIGRPGRDSVPDKGAVCESSYGSTHRRSFRIAPTTPTTQAVRAALAISRGNFPSSDGSAQRRTSGHDIVSSIGRLVATGRDSDSDASAGRIDDYLSNHQRDHGINKDRAFCERVDRVAIEVIVICSDPDCNKITGGTR